MYTVFICRKCGHNLYAEETPDFGEKLGRICAMDCPNCGEEGYDNWILSCRKREFPGNEKVCAKCIHFLGMGDWNLCCDRMYGLCYEDTKACDDFDEKKEVKDND